ncbi:hypothetical protein ACIO1C_30145 [Streptomyces sp. NPDC087420]|uniref:hypothetical protein n=1 Tax=Streptomyces sp. NPDC087420 TaxID=3365785 RepID=UPI00383540D6
MTRFDREETEVRRLLDTPHPVVPADLAPRALARGGRLRHRRRTARRLLWLTLITAVILFAVWASVTEPWSPPPMRTTPPLEGG